MFDKLKCYGILEEYRKKQGWTKAFLTKSLRIAFSTYERLGDKDCVKPTSEMTQKKLLSFIKRKELAL